MRCILCDSETMEFLDLGRQPMANKYPADPMAPEEFFPVKVLFCSECKNVQLDTTVSRDAMFVDYYYLSSVNKALVDYYEKFAKTLSNAKFVVDVGSNDGISLKPLREMGIKFLGVDPSINVGKIANDAGLTTKVAFFDDKTVQEIIAEYGKADVITGLSMFSHLQNQHQFIEDAKKLLTDDGKFIVEVEYNVEMLKKLAFERFYLDRISYFSVTSFSKLFEQHDMYVQNAEVTPIHGGSLRITAQKNWLGSPQIEAVSQLMEEEKEMLTLDKLKDFGVKAKMMVGSLKDKLIEYKKTGLKVAAYGSPARLSTITNFGDIGPDLISFVVDDSPLKQNRFSPGKHIPIVSNERLTQDNPDILLVFAYDYLDDIRSRLTKQYRYLLPIPPREIK